MGGECDLHGEIIDTYTVLVGEPEVKDHSEDLGVDERII